MIPVTTQNRSLSSSHDDCWEVMNIIPSPAPETMYINFSTVVTLDGVWDGHECDDHDYHFPVNTYAEAVMNICFLPVSKLYDQLECPEYHFVADSDETVLVTP